MVPNRFWLACLRAWPVSGLMKRAAHRDAGPEDQCEDDPPPPNDNNDFLTKA